MLHARCLESEKCWARHLTPLSKLVLLDLSRKHFRIAFHGFPTKFLLFLSYHTWRRTIIRRITRTLIIQLLSPTDTQTRHLEQGMRAKRYCTSCAEEEMMCVPSSALLLLSISCGDATTNTGGVSGAVIMLLLLPADYCVEPRYCLMTRHGERETERRRGNATDVIAAVGKYFICQGWEPGKVA